MFYVSNHIQQIPGVKDCTRHKSTYSSGRWNVHTTADHFSTITKTLQTHLSQWALSYTNQENIDLCDLPPPNVVFKTTPFELSTPGASYDTYISACSSLYAMEDVEPDLAPFHQPPLHGSSPVTQAWRSPLPVPTIVKTRTVATTLSPISLDQFKRICHENERLVQEMANLKIQLHQLPNRETIQEAPNIDAHISCIVSAVLQAMQSGTSLPPTTRAASPTATRNPSELPSQDACSLPDSVLDTTMGPDHSFDDGAS
ncbi:hypothetical protein ACA910_000541 [Epithemia clementina (nom. ined.)]